MSPKNNQNNLSVSSTSLRRRILLGLYLIPTPEGMVIQNIDPATPAAQTDLKPGDLLTTSSIPGYAMKALDYSRAQGAILGKAMQELAKGETGQILVLVTLQ